MVYGEQRIEKYSPRQLTLATHSDTHWFFVRFVTYAECVLIKNCWANKQIEEKGKDTGLGI